MGLLGFVLIGLAAAFGRVWVCLVCFGWVQVSQHPLYVYVPVNDFLEKKDIQNGKYECMYFNCQYTVSNA